MNNKKIFENITLKVLFIMLSIFIYFIFSSYYFSLKYLTTEDFSFFDFNYFIEILPLIIISFFILIVSIGVVKKTKYKFISLLGLFLLTISFNFEMVENYISKINYDNLQKRITNINPKVKDTEIYSEFLFDLKNNNKNKLSNYINVNNGSFVDMNINPKLISVEKDKQFQIIILSKLNFSDNLIKEKVEDINKDSFISVYEYEQLKEDVSKSSNNEIIALLN
jgi:hypothetical protein